MFMWDIYLGSGCSSVIFEAQDVHVGYLLRLRMFMWDIY
jgi:hypothetical protein